MTKEISKAVKQMLSVYDEKGLLLTHGILKHFVKINAPQCVAWTLSMVEPYMEALSKEAEVKSSLSVIRECISNPSESMYAEVFRLTWSAWNARYEIWEGPKLYLALAGLGWACQGLILRKHFSTFIEKEEASEYDFYQLKDYSQEERDKRLSNLITSACSKSLNGVYDSGAIPNGQLLVAKSFEEAITDCL
ncbi:MAG: hypothetical protein AAF587_27395 [Bacteroidota bacterium]